MTVTVGINGFGRIGRCTLSHIAASGRNDVRVIKANATGPIETAAHLMRYDSIHGRFGNDIRVGERTLDLGRGEIEMFSTYDPNELDWSGCDVVLECTGKFNDGEKARVHLERGAGAVLISAPAKNVDKTIVFGVNDNSFARRHDDLERVLHHQLPCPRWPRCWTRPSGSKRHDDDDPRLYRRPADARPAPPISTAPAPPPCR
jgi:glyceraldehyde-3-phosphate dehydrogenase type I